MSTYALRKKWVEIVRLDVGKTEDSPNRAPWIAKLWPATNLGYNGCDDRLPYCAAGQCYGLREWLKLPEVLAALGKTAEQAEKWRCKSAGAWAWMDWAETNGVIHSRDTKNFVLHTADLMVFNIHHIELVVDDDADSITTIGYNTGDSSIRDGEGCFQRRRTRRDAQMFIRPLP